MRASNHVCGWHGAAIALASVTLLSGCGGGSDKAAPATAANEPAIVQPGAPGEPSRRISADEVDTKAATRYTRDDVAFVQGMIHHHGQALLMANWVPRRSASRDVPVLARRMEISQESEIELMQQWLKDRGIEPRDVSDHGGHDHGSGKGLPPGMLTVAQLGRLYTAKGEAFDRLFLRYMIHHHRGALTMVRDLRARNGGMEPELDNMIREIEADQETEIGRMRVLLGESR